MVKQVIDNLNHWQPWVTSLVFGVIGVAFGTGVTITTLRQNDAEMIRRFDAFERKLNIVVTEPQLNSRLKIYDERIENLTGWVRYNRDLLRRLQEQQSNSRSPESIGQSPYGTVPAVYRYWRYQR